MNRKIVSTQWRHTCKNQSEKDEFIKTMEAEYSPALINDCTENKYPMVVDVDFHISEVSGESFVDEVYVYSV